MDADIRVLYEEDVFMRWKYVGAEDQFINALVRLEFGSLGQKQGNVMRLRLTNKDNLYFLQSLEITEEDFQTMKHEQALLVDFATFPHKTIELFKLVVASKDEEVPRYVAQLSTRSNGIDSTLEIIETNPFKHLVHLALGFRSGNDASVKKYLAGEMQVLQAAYAKLAGDHVDLTETLGSLRTELASAIESEQNREQVRERVTIEARVEHANQLTEAKERYLAETQALRERYDEETANIRSQFEGQISQLGEQLTNTQDTCTVLKEDLAERDRIIRELTASISSLEANEEKLNATVTELRDSNADLSSLVHNSDIAQSRNNAEITSLKTQLSDAHVNIDRVQALADAANLRAAGVDETLDWHKNHMAKLDEKLHAGIEEINKANQIIQTLQTELKATRSKAKAARNSLREREEAVIALKESSKNSDRDMESMRRQLEAMEKEKERVEAQVVTLTSKLAEAQGIIEGNQKVMAYLNSELTERRLGTGRHIGTAIPKPKISPKTEKKATTVPLTTTAPMSTTTAPAWPPRAAPRFTSFSNTEAVNPLLNRPWVNDENAVVNETIANAVAQAKDAKPTTVFPAGLVPESV